MTPQDPLAALAPLREPPPVSWWPPAPGWWLLAGLALAASTWLAWRYWRRYRRNAYRRQALRQLDELQAAQASLPDDTAFAARLNALLKSAALAAYPAHQVAAQHGAQWLALLNAPLSETDRFDPGFAEAGYRGGISDLDRDRAMHSARQWLRLHRVTP